MKQVALGRKAWLFVTHAPTSGTRCSNCSTVSPTTRACCPTFGNELTQNRSVGIVKKNAATKQIARNYAQPADAYLNNARNREPDRRSPHLSLLIAYTSVRCQRRPKQKRRLSNRCHRLSEDDIPRRRFPDSFLQRNSEFVSPLAVIKLRCSITVSRSGKLQSV